MARRSHDALRARDHGRTGIPLIDTPADHPQAQRYPTLSDDPNFYRAMPRRCLCPHRRTHHAPATCPALPPWMTLTLPHH